MFLIIFQIYELDSISNSTKLLVDNVSDIIALCCMFNFNYLYTFVHSAQIC